MKATKHNSRPIVTCQEKEGEIKDLNYYTSKKRNLKNTIVREPRNRDLSN